MRAREPDESGYAVNDGIRLYYEVFGAGDPTVLLLPTVPIVTSRHWKAQVPFLARHYRVVTFDPRGNGLSDRPAAATAYDDDAYVSDIGAVLAATGTDAAVLVGLCFGVRWAALFAAANPDRALGPVRDRGQHRAAGAAASAPDELPVQRRAGDRRRAGQRRTCPTGAVTTAGGSSSTPAS